MYPIFQSVVAAGHNDSPYSDHERLDLKLTMFEPLLERICWNVYAPPSFSKVHLAWGMDT